LNSVLNRVCFIPFGALFLREGNDKLIVARATAYLVLVIGWVGNAYADYLTGEELLGNCNQQVESTERGICTGYLAGVAASAQFIQLYFPGVPPGEYWSHTDVCIPDGVTIEQLRIVWLKSAAAYSRDLHHEAIRLVVRAFGEAWPCEVPSRAKN
jgi:Rap1a immunity proteins